MAGKQQTSTKETMKNNNVAGGKLALFSKDPPTGFYRDGYCRVGPEDKGNHSIAAVVTEDFLSFSASKGNNLKDVGVKDGMKWCLCASRWKEAFDAAQKGSLKKEAVPRVYLHASHDAALQTLSYKDLKQYSAEGEAPSQQNRQETHHDPNTQGSIAKKTTELGGSSETTGLATGEKDQGRPSSQYGGTPGSGKNK